MKRKILSVASIVLALVLFYRPDCRADDDPKDPHAGHGAAPPEPAAEGEDAAGGQPAAAEEKNKWKSRRMGMLRFREDVRTEDGAGPIYLIINEITEKTLKYEREHPPLTQKDYDDLIRASESSRKARRLARQLSVIKERVDSEDVKPEEKRLLLVKRQAISKEMGGVMFDQMPKALHDDLMPPVTDPLKKIGFDMDDHASQYKEVQPGAPSYAYSGNHHLGKNDAQSAAADFNRALQYDPRNQAALSGRALANFQLGDYQAAYNDAARALELKPDDKTAISVMKLSEGRGASAGEALAQAQGQIQADSSQFLAAGGGAGFRPASSNAGAIGASAQATRDAANALRLGDLKGAISQSDRAIALNAQNAQAFNYRAIARNGLGLYDAALKDAVAGLRLAPKSLALLNTKAYALNRMKNYAAALEAADMALSFNPNDAAAHANRAYALGGMGDREGMLNELRKAASLDSRFQSSLDSALQMPADSDVLFLFPGEKPRAPGAGAAATAPGRGKSLLVVSLLSLVGGGVFFLLIYPKLARKPEQAPARKRAEGELLNEQFKILRQIGAGGMGVVYEGTDRSLDRKVAIKKMRPELAQDRRERERFISEAKTVAALHHPNIVDIYSVVEDGPDVYLIFEHVSGKTVFDLLAERGPMPLPQALGVVKAMGEALEFAHGRGIIHRDLKTSNVMVDGEGRVKVMDFGIARVAKDAVTRFAMTNTVLGTPPYMAPEQEQGVVCRESDVYALAICFYEMLSGKLPFTGSGANMLLNKMNRSYAPISSLVPSLPKGLDEFFAKALAPNPRDRIASAREFVEAAGAPSFGSLV